MYRVVGMRPGDQEVNKNAALNIGLKPVFSFL